MKTFTLLLLLLISLTGCSLPLKSEQPQARTFRLSPTIPTPTQPALKAHLYLPPVSVTPGLDSRHIVLLRSPYEQDFIANSQWPDELPTYLHAILTDALSASHSFSSVSDTQVNSQNTYKLLLKFSAFQTERPSDQPDSAIAKVAMEAFLVRSRDQKLVMQRRYQASKYVNKIRVTTLVQALNQVLGEVLENLLNDLLAQPTVSYGKSL